MNNNININHEIFTNTNATIPTDKSIVKADTTATMSKKRTSKQKSTTKRIRTETSQTQKTNKK